jgi:pimeloyl-ACP methyl ester carboxylesterase
VKKQAAFAPPAPLGYGRRMVIAAVLAGLPLLALMAIAVLYAVDCRRSDTGPESMPTGAAVGAFLHEWLAVLAWLGAAPFRVRRAAGELPARGVAVFIPELHGSSGGFWYLRRRLRAAGWDSIAGAEHIGRASGQDVMAALDARIAALAIGTELVLIGHGIGGRLALRYAEARAALPIRHVVTLATPHRGSDALPYRLLAAAQHGLPPACHTPGADVIAVYSEFDAWLRPLDGAYCPGAFNIAVRGIGHCAVLLSRRVADLIVENLTAPAPSRRGAP